MISSWIWSWNVTNDNWIVTSPRKKTIKTECRHLVAICNPINTKKHFVSNEFATRDLFRLLANSLTLQLEPSWQKALASVRTRLTRDFNMRSKLGKCTTKSRQLPLASYAIRRNLTSSTRLYWYQLLLLLGGRLGSAELYQQTWPSANIKVLVFGGRL